MIIIENGKREVPFVSFPPFLPVIYETLRTYDKKLFAFEEHFERLLRSASYLSMDLPFSSEDLLSILQDLAARFEKEAYFRIYVTAKGDFYIEVKRLEDKRVVADVGFSQFRRAPESVIPSQLKAVSRTDVMLARHTRGNFYDVLMLNAGGYLAEGSFSSVFLVKGGKLITPCLESGILDGITRRYTIALAKDVGIEVEERLVEPWEIFEAEEIFLTHTSQEIVPVRSVQGKVLECPGKITKLLQESFRGFVTKKI